VLFTSEQRSLVAANKCSLPYPGAPQAVPTTTLDIRQSEEVRPMYRVLDESGKLINPKYKVKVLRDLVGSLAFK